MKSRVIVMLLGTVLLAVSYWTGTPSREAIAEGEKPGSTPQQPLALSLFQLIATPDVFEGKYVRVFGFVRIEHEGTALFLHREDADHMLTKNGLWLAVNDAPAEGSKEAQVKNRYALIEGRFTAKKTGHMGLWSGSIDEITRMVPWEIRNAPPNGTEKPPVEATLHGEWKGGACQGTFIFKADGTYQLKQWSPGNYSLSGTWAIRWDALPPTLVLKCKESSHKEYVGRAWEMKVPQLDGESLSLAFNSATEGKETIKYTRVKKSAELKKAGESDYIKVEIRGKLRVTDKQQVALEIEELAKEPVYASVHDMRLAFGEDKELADLAKKLDGKTVIVSGSLARVPAERIAVKPTNYLSYIKVTELKAAE